MSEAAPLHNPVMLAETLEALALPRGGTCVDATFGRGGHSRALCEAVGPEGRVLALDRDPEAIAYGRSVVAIEYPNLTLVQANFAEMGRACRMVGLPHVDGVLMDLGLSSPQLDPESGRGFSFEDRTGLSMLMDPEDGLGAGEWLDKVGEEELAHVLRHYGDEPRARAVARAILASRRKGAIRSTADLAEAVRSALPPRGRSHIDPCTRSLQAIRMVLNDEPESLRRGLREALAMLREGGRLAVLAYHSGEDRIVKTYFAEAVRGCTCPPRAPRCVCGRSPWARLLFRGVRTVGVEEAERNPRARSARLRVAERIGEVPEYEGS